MMLAEFTSFVSQKNLFTTHDSLLLAVSGGVDSVVLSHLFYKTKVKFAIAHCNFSLRGQESEQDELFVKELADSYKVKFHTKSFDTTLYSKQNKVSIQMSARKLRYDWFAELHKTYKYTKVATAHHINDSLETILLNLTKGTGISGLLGIPYCNNIYIRPLNFALKSEIVEYAKKNALKWRTDSSNAKECYQRNFIRNNIITLLKQINPNIEKTSLSTIEKLNQVHSLWEHCVTTTGNEIIQQRNDCYHIAIESIINKPWGATMFFELVKNFGFNFEQVQNLFHGKQKCGKKILSKDHMLCIDRSAWIVSPLKDNKKASKFIITEDNGFIIVNGYKLKFTKFDIAVYKIKYDNKIAALDYDLLTFPLNIRQWQQGDFFYPLGMTAKKKASDFFIDNKIPLHIKQSIYVVTSNSDVVCIPGYRIDNRFKVTTKTQRVFEMCLEPIF